MLLRCRRVGGRAAPSPRASNKQRMWTSAAAAMNHDWFTKHATELSTTDLSKTIDNMKKWNARRKLKGGIKAVMASNRVAAAARGGQ